MKTTKWKNGCSVIRIAPILMIILAGCAGNRILTKPYSPEKMIHYSQLKGWDEAKSLNNYIVYINPGETIPLKISMETDFMDFKQDRIDIVVKEKLYFMIKMPENLSAEELSRLKKLTARSFSEMSDAQKAAFFKEYMIYVSKDSVHWAPLYGSKAYREILGFKAGMVSFGIMASTTEGLGAILDIKTVK